MPEQGVLHKAHALAFHGVGNHAGWLSWLQRNCREHFSNVVRRVAINLSHCPAESLPLRGEGLQLDDLFHSAQTLDLVVVHDGDEVVQSVVRRKERRLPDRSFITLSIAQESK